MRRWVWATALCGACVIEIDVRRPEDAPTARVLQPGDGEVVAAGRVLLVGEVDDAVDPAERLFVQWQRGAPDTPDEGPWEGLCADEAASDGSTLCVADLTPGAHRLRILVKDVAGFEGVATVDVTAEAIAAPVITALGTVGEGPWYAGVPVPLHATITDGDHAADTLTLTWRLEGAGNLPLPGAPLADGSTGGSYAFSEGEQRIVLVARDPDGAETADELRLVVGPASEAPTLRLLPDAGRRVVATGDGLVLDGVALDADVDATRLSVRATCCGLDPVDATPGPLGAFSLDLGVLPEGLHDVEVAATDEVGVRTALDVEVLVDAPPDLAWTVPADGAAVALGTPIELRGTVSDARSGADAVVLEVFAEPGGRLGGGAPVGGAFALAVSLPAGTYTLTLQATDSDGLSTSVEREITVTP